MKKFLSMLFFVTAICLTASAQQQATARVLVPSDCEMNISNGLWLGWFDGEYEDDAATINYVQMTPEAGGRIFTASFTPAPAQEYYGYFFVNASSMSGDYQRTDAITYLDVLDTLCWEVTSGYGNWFYYSQSNDCQLADHNYKPTNLTATPLGKDSVLFEWQVPGGVEYYSFSINCFKGEDDGYSSYQFYVSEGDQRSLRAKLNTPYETAISYWTIDASAGYGTYTARGNGFVVEGDASMLPNNLKATPLGRDSILFEWQLTDEEGIYQSFEIQCYDADDSPLFTNWQVNESAARSARVKANKPYETVVAYWKLKASQNYYEYVEAQGAGFTIAGDERLVPHNLSANPFVLDSILFTWELTDEEGVYTSFTVTCYDEQNNELFSWYADEATARSLRVKAGVINDVEVAYWKLYAQKGWYDRVDAKGTGFTIHGDAGLQMKNLAVTPLGRDSFLFTWEAASNPPQNYYIQCYKGEYDNLFGSTAKPNERSLRAKFGNRESVEVAYWTITTYDGRNQSIQARGEGFTVAGDDRIPTNLTISSDGEHKYTIRWKAGAGVDHFYVEVGYDKQFDNVTERSLQVMLDDNDTYHVAVFSRDAAGNDLGNIETYISTSTQEPRDLVLHFYIPALRGFIGTNGAALKWRDSQFDGDHYVALVAEGTEAPNWYKATIAGFNRQAVYFSIINAQTAEAATKTVEYSGTFGQYGTTETYLVLGERSDDGELYLDGSGYQYPHDYAASNLQLKQELNKLIFTWNSSEDVDYYLNAYDAEGNQCVSGRAYAGENRYEYTSNNDHDFIITKWSLTPYAGWSSVASMSVYNTDPFTVKRSPFLPKNLKAQENNDGTWTFSWDAAAADTVKQYGIEVKDASGSTVFSRYNLKETAITDKVNFMFSGRCAMCVYAYNSWGGNLGSAVDSFTLAPVAEHDITIRVLINPLSGYDTNEGVKFDIKSSAKGDYEPVNATDDKYGWWKYKLTTTERGAYVRLDGIWRNFAVYGDTCVAYTGYFEEEECDAHADDYMPQNLLAMDNGDGTWTLSWSMDYTERVSYYYVNVIDANGAYVFSDNVKALQLKTPVLSSTGRYTYSVGVYNNNSNQIGYADSSFTVLPKVEHDIVLRVLVQPGSAEGWGAFTYDAESGEYIVPVVFTPAEEGWYTKKFTTTDPAVTVRFKQNAYYYYGTDFTFAENTCIEYDTEFKKVDCDKAKLQNYTLSNLKVENLGAGKFGFSWACEDNPYQFQIRACQADSITSVWSTNVNGEDRAVTARFNNDSTMEIVWYIVPIKRMDYSNTYLWDKRAYGPNFTAEASAYIPQNVKATPAGDGSWNISWDALPAAVTRYMVNIIYPSGNTDYLYPASGKITCNTSFLTEVGIYKAIVYAQNNSYETLGQASINFSVSEVTERVLNVRLLLHPDAGRSIEQMQCETGNDIWEWKDPIDEGNGWYRFTFSSTMPAPEVKIFGYQPTIIGDTCLQYTSGNLSAAPCNEVAHDYRIKAGSLKAVSNPGYVTFSWEAVEKSKGYELEIMKYEEEYGYWNTLDYVYASDTFLTYIVADRYDGMEIKWSVRPSYPHSLNRTDAAELVTLHKSEIILSKLKVTTTDSVHYRLAWDSNNSEVQYQLQIRIGGTGLVDTQLTGKQYDFTAITGYSGYDWQVRAVNAAGEPLTTWAQAETFYAKSDLRLLSNLKGTAVGHALHFSWTSSVPRITAQLWREESAWGRVPMFPSGDSIISGNTFDMVVTEDGRYAFEVYALVETSPTTSASIYENNIAYVNVFTETTTYTVNVSTTVGGTFNGMNPSGEYPEGYKLRICPSSEVDYRFVSWSDGDESECRMITITGDTTLIALYEAVPEYHVVIAAESGWIRNRYTEDTVARIDTVVKGNYYFSIEAVAADKTYELYKWSDGYDRRNTYRGIDISSDTTITAIFKPVCYVTVAAGDGGRVQLSGDAQYDKSTKTYRCSWGTEITIKANPNDGYRFKKWSDNDVNVTRTIVVTGNINLTAQFEVVGAPLDKYVLRVLSSDTELGDVNQVSGNYFDGDKVTIIATPQEHANFVGWSDGAAQPTRVITVSSDTTLIAQFEYKRVTLTISAGQGGAVNTEVNGTYNYGTKLTLTATPDEGYHFVSWSDGETAPVREVRLTENTELTAQFAMQTYLVTFLNADGSYLDANYWLYGQTPSCAVQPTMDSTDEWVFIFKGWTPEIVAVKGNAVYYAVYDKVPNTGAGWEETNVTERATKVLVNGQFFIIRGNKVYTITGQVLK